MKTPVNTGEASLPPAPEAGWDAKVRAEQDGASEKPGFGVAKGLDKPREERMIAKTSGKA
jgi:hypothetical protein